MIVVLDGRKEDQVNVLRPIANENEWLRVIQFSRQFGESAALMAGFNEARGDIVMTLPAYYQVDTRELFELITSLGSDDDMLVAVRAPRIDTVFARIRRRVFHGMLRWITGLAYRDLGCGVRLMKKEVSEELNLYGDHYVFLPVLAVQRGFRVREIELAQSPKDRNREGYNLRQHLHGLLNMMTVFFLHRFTKKPLRFFGSIGFLATAFGGAFVLILVIQRLFFGVALADRPALLLGSLMIVLGVQLFALGLLDYRIQKGIDGHEK
jgi:glycosyltransferase involved in cell wall biosynthesis